MTWFNVNVTLTIKDKTQIYDYSNEGYKTVPSHGAFYSIIYCATEWFSPGSEEAGF